MAPCFNYDCYRNTPLLFSLLLVNTILQSRVPGCTRARVLGISCPFSSTHQHTPAVTLHCSAEKAPSFGLHSGMNIPRSGCLQRSVVIGISDRTFSVIWRFFLSRGQNCCLLLTSTHFSSLVSNQETMIFVSSQ